MFPKSSKVLLTHVKLRVLRVRPVKRCVVVDWECEDGPFVVVWVFKQGIEEAWNAFELLVVRLLRQVVLGVARFWTQIWVEGRE